MADREPHWVRVNHQERMPPRMIAFDTEAKSEYIDDKEIQTWRTGCAIRWRTDLKTGDHREARVFDTPLEFWQWVAEFTRPGTRTVVWAHNLGYDVRISQMFTILPTLGYRLEWCNLDRNISSATWRSDNGTIVLADTWTWIPMSLRDIAPQVGMVKYEMPASRATDLEWSRYCMQDAEILYNVCSVLVAFIKDHKLGNWQPTGAGMAMATWRHKFLTDKVLVHDDQHALQAERIAMHTGRAEAWRHGTIYGEKWTEVDLRNAYLTIASECEVPRKLHMHTGALSLAQYRDLYDRFAVLCRVVIDTPAPSVPYRTKDRHVWPVGRFETWLWDEEVNTAIKYGASVTIRESYCYSRAPVLQSWAKWVMNVLRDETLGIHPLARTHVKHCSRALIGRLALRTPSWETFGSNPEGITGITHVTYPDEGRTTRMLHVGDQTLIETERIESKNSLPQITGWIMAKCRAILWEAMNICGLDHIAHVDTDSVLVDATGLAQLRMSYGRDFSRYWSVKGTYRKLEVWGPRAYWRDGQRVSAGIPLRATQTGEATFEGERWSSLSADLAAAQGASVTIAPGSWELRRTDPRRDDSPGVCGRTEAYSAESFDSPNRSSSESPGTGL